MRRYEQVSVAFFCLLAIAQLTRLVFRWPVVVAGFAVPVWVSGVAVVIMAMFAIWGFRAMRRSSAVA